MESAYLICMNCVVAATGNVLIIRKRSGDTTIPIQNIQSVKLNPPTRWINRGYLTISTSEAPAAYGIGYFGKMVAMGGGETSLEFTPENMPDAEKVRDYIINFQNGSGVVSSGADELIKYKQLLDMGAITQDEFDRKKREILGL